MKKPFSVIIPTYSGEEHIGKCLRAILDQKNGFKFEVVVVVDGPKPSLRAKVEEFKKTYDTAKVPFTIHQFKKNQGRFTARLEGAKLAKHPQLLFVDDRAVPAAGFIDELESSGKRIVLPNVIEGESRNFISRTLFLLRTAVYRGKFGDTFDSYTINAENFESSPKGTTALWAPKDVFIQACKALEGSDNKNTNEDTKLFRAMIEQGETILRSSTARLYYHPRSTASAELFHIYERGPRFIDYYSKPGTRFYLPMVGSILAVLIVLVILALYPSLLRPLVGFKLAAILVLAALLSRKAGDIPAMVFGFPLVAAFFAAGLFRGIWVKLVKA